MKSTALPPNERMLLHSCCAPCSGTVIERLKEQVSITLYYANPNIHPAAEYTKRLGELERWCRDTINIPLIVPPYNPTQWFQRVAGLEHEPEKGKRCTQCYALRLEETACYAAEHGYDTFSTVLSISPHKDATRINALGTALGEQFKIPFYQANFKKEGGFQRSLVISRENNFYRQTYCGCIYSQR